MRRILLGLTLALGMLGLAACDGGGGGEFRIISGSENKPLEPILQSYCRDKGWTCKVDYKGSVDIRLLLEEENFPYDAVWPAHSRWIALGDRKRRVKHARSIMRSPVALGIVRGKAQELGLIGKDVTTAEIVDLVRSGKLRFLMTSATQSNSGFSAYIAMLTALAGSPEVLTAGMLDNADLQAKLKTVLRGVQRTSGSSGWLKTLFLEGAASGAYKAMFNYEAVLIETNLELERRKLETLYIVYPKDGVAVADSPLGYVARGDESKEKFFLDLQKHLLSPKVQARLSKLGRRTGLGGKAINPDPRIFRKEWGIDLDKVLPEVRFPAAPVIEKALAMYQGVLRKPSLLAFCLDFSGSMGGDGETQLKRAINLLFDPATSRWFMLQATPRDVFLVIPFDARPRELMVAVGPNEARDLSGRVSAMRANGGTDIYRCAMRALEEMRKRTEYETYTLGVILMTDGKSDEKNRGRFERMYRESGGDIPIYSITFGDADPSQLKALAKLTRARVFDGRKNLERAFRQARGYN